MNRLRGIMFDLRMIVIGLQKLWIMQGVLMEILWSLTKQHAHVNGEILLTVVQKYGMDTILQNKENV